VPYRTSTDLVRARDAAPPRHRIRVERDADADGSAPGA
jgi:hypothetical protein